MLIPKFQTSPNFKLAGPEILQFFHQDDRPKWIADYNHTGRRSAADASYRAERGKSTTTTYNGKEASEGPDLKY